MDKMLFLLFGCFLISLFVYVVLSLLEGLWNSLKDLFEALFGGGSSESDYTSTDYSSSNYSSSSSSSSSWYTPPRKSKSSWGNRETNYTRDWSSVARKYKESRSWRCEKCYVNLSDKRHRRLLHVHHRDLNPQNNYSWNLIALCVICHSEEPGAGHKRLAGTIKKDGRYDEVRRLRW